jgi:hypothetical protein
LYFDLEEALTPLGDLLCTPAGQGSPATPSEQTGPPPPPSEQYVTLDQMAGLVNRSKRTLEKRKRRKNTPLPDPDVAGGGGKPDEWKWSAIRPWLEKEFGRQLPEQFPAGRFLAGRADRS